MADNNIVLQLRDVAKHRNLEIHEIWAILINYEQIKFPVSTRVFDTSNGALYLFDRAKTPHFKDDGVPYQLKKNRGRVREDYTKHEAVVDGVKMVVTQYKAVTPDKRRSRYCFCIPASFSEVGKTSRMHVLHYRGNEAETDEMQLATSLLGLQSHQSIDMFSPMRGPMVGDDREKVVLVLKQPLEEQDQFNTSLVVKFGDVPIECEVKNPYTVVVMPPELRCCPDIYKETKIRIERASSSEFIAGSEDHYTFFSVRSNDDDDDDVTILMNDNGNPIVNLNPQYSIGVSYNSNGTIIDSAVNPQRIANLPPEIATKSGCANSSLIAAVTSSSNGLNTHPQASVKLENMMNIVPIVPDHNLHKRKAIDLGGFDCKGSGSDTLSDTSTDTITGDFVGDEKQAIENYDSLSGKASEPSMAPPLYFGS